MVLALDNPCSSKQLLGALGVNTGARSLPKSSCHPFQGSAVEMQAACGRWLQNCPRHTESAAVRAAQQCQKCADCSAHRHHIPFSCSFPISTRHWRSTRHSHQGKQWQRREHLLGDTRDSPFSSTNTQSKGCFWQLTGQQLEECSHVRSAAEEQVMLQWHRLLAPRSQATTDNSASCWHRANRLGPEGIRTRLRRWPAIILPSTLETWGRAMPPWLIPEPSAGPGTSIHVSQSTDEICPAHSDGLFPLQFMISWKQIPSWHSKTSHHKKQSGV